MKSRGSIDAWFLGAAAALAMAAPSLASADDLTIQGVNIERTITCDERDVVIYGSNHRLTLHGRCQQVWVHGTGHVIHVERLGSADITGVNNRLEWEHALRGDQPDIEITGLGNRAMQAESRPAPRRSEGAAPEGKPAAPRSYTIEEGDQHRTYDCAGGSVTVESGENQLTLRQCPELTVHGADNRIVMVGPVRLIRLHGNDNTVEWSEGEGGKPPKVENPGSGNRVMRK